jgi:hypothetical protein
MLGGSDMQDISFDFDLASWSPGGFLRSMPYRGCPLCLVFRSKSLSSRSGNLIGFSLACLGFLQNRVATAKSDKNKRGE